MADKKKIADEKKIAEENLSDEGEASTDELDKVAGGMIDLWCVQNKNPNTDTITGKEKIISFGK